jgi:hypothetical protein
LETNRNKLIQALESKEKEYLTGYYQPKEHSFCRAYTSRYLNLGVHSTQRNKKYHDVSGIRLSKNITVGRAIQIITDRVKRLPRQYEDRINKDRIATPRLIDRQFFQLYIGQFTIYCLELAKVELVQAKEFLHNLKDSEVEELEFDPEVGCTLECLFPL